MRRPPSSILVVLSSPLSRQLDQAGARAEDDGYRLQIHVRDGRVRLYTMNGADWSKRYTLIVESAAWIDGAAIIDAEVVWIGSNGVADFDPLHSRVDDKSTVALAFDLLALNGEDLRRKPFFRTKVSAAENPEADTVRRSICRAYLGRRQGNVQSRLQT